jgi:predicted GNAT superfamily acetyltransferase
VAAPGGAAAGTLVGVMLRPSTSQDDDLILAWNEADVDVLSPMDAARLVYLRRRAHAVDIIEAAGVAAGFVITFTEGSDYDSENYRWFSEREPAFHYVDRIVIDPGHRGRGLARRVYDSLLQRFPDRPLVAEVTIEPPNRTSLAFHASMGFSEVGRLGGRPYGVVLLKLSPADASGEIA